MQISNIVELSVRKSYHSKILLHRGVCLRNGTAHYYVIRKYGSTFYIGIAMVVLPYFGPWENRNLSSHFQFPLNLISTITKVEHMLISGKKSRYFHRVAMFFIFFFFFFFCFRLKSSISITETPTNMKICMYTYFVLACALSDYILVNPFTSCVTDRDQYKQCIMM